jgi:hypothetical protein
LPLHGSRDRNADLADLLPHHASRCIDTSARKIFARAGQENPEATTKALIEFFK